MILTWLGFGLAGYALAACRITRPLLWDRFYENVVWRGPKDTIRRISLTFDDGPDPWNTPRLLDVLKRHNVCATFFLIGKRAVRYPQLVERIHEAGHEIGNHSYSHNKLIFCSRSVIEQEIDGGATALQDAIGFKPKLFRPPYGLRDPRVLAVTADRGDSCILWSIMPWDWILLPTGLIIRWVNYRVHHGAIITLHDGGGDRSRTVDAVDKLLPCLLNRGFQLTTVSELLSS